MSDEELVEVAASLVILPEPAASWRTVEYLVIRRSNGMDVK
jgi:hypothetical protein